MGISLELGAGIALLSWIQAGDSECFYDHTGPFAELRMCDPLIVGDAQPMSYICLAVIVVIFLVGALVRHYGTKGK